MKTTIEYFNLSMDELLVTNEYGYTKEENLLFDDGLRVLFFDDEKELKTEKTDIEAYMNTYNYEVKTILKTINERIALILI